LRGGKRARFPDTPEDDVVTMRTIVFHSYKGGVGRSLALANLGVALSRLGKKVLLLDLDVDAPGLHLKFLGDNKDSLINVDQGYVDYLSKYFRPPDVVSTVARILKRSTEPDKNQRIADLRSIAKEIKSNLKIVPAGSGNIEYWWKLADRWFQELFSLNQKEISISSGIALHRHRDFLQKELEIFKDVFDEGTDYLLVDCRSSREYSSVPLYYWAHVVVSMFPDNPEGIRGAVHTHQAVLKARKVAETPPMVFPVVCRVPESFSTKDADDLWNKFLDYWKSLDPEGKLKVPQEGLCVLREYRSLEMTERLLLPMRDVGAAVDEINVQLAHDYADLFRRILVQDESVANALPATDEKAWKAALGLAEDVRVLEGYFTRLADGELYNEDKKRNVAFRAESLLSMMNSLCKSERDSLEKRGHRAADIDDWVLGSFLQAGSDIGRDFGQEAMEVERVFKGKIPEQEGDRLSGWCAFDQRAGFGTLSHEYDPRTGCGLIRWTKSFLLESGTLQPHVKEFARGYVRGVLCKLLMGEVEVSVGATNSENFEFRLQRKEREAPQG
jgi:MinD-like ATPase involved in chromosome partitioning or flagellar assembly